MKYLIFFIVLFAVRVNYSQWLLIDSSSTIIGYNYTFFLNENTGWVDGYFSSTSKVKKTTNGGNSWNLLDNGSQFLSLDKMIFTNINTGFALQQQGVCKTTDGGINWTYTLINGFIAMRGMFFSDSLHGWIVGSYNDGSNVYGRLTSTTNGGTNWVLTNGGGQGELWDVHFANNLTGWIVGGYGSGSSNVETIQKTTDGGLNWVTQTTGLSNKNLYAVNFINSETGWAVGHHSSSTSGVIFKTTNGGTNWSSQNLSGNFEVVKFTSENTGWIAANNKLYKTTNGGLNFINQYNYDTSASGYYIKSLFFVNNNLGFATGWIIGHYNFILRTTNGGDPIGIENISTEIPKHYNLSQNYPNPFNPTTNITFDVTTKENVKLTIFDVLGREITMLVNQKLQAGSYKVDWDGSNYASGLYFYKLEVNDFQQTKKMVLIK